MSTTETDRRVRRALDGDSDGLRSRVLPLDDIEILSRAKGGDGRTVVAYAATFGNPAEIHDQDGHYTEENHPQAFHKTVADRGLRFGAFYHHGRTLHGTPSERGSVPIGRPVLVKPDGRGLLTHTAYNRTQLADDVLESIRNGDPMGMSYTGAYLQSDPKGPYYSRSDGSLQHVVRKEIALIEYGPTPMPAFADAEILGVRAAQAREADRAAGNEPDATRPDAAQPYQRRPGEDVQCPSCGKYNQADANYCDQCGAELPDSAFPGGGGATGARQSYQQAAGETVQCPACSRWNEPDAIFCDQCGAKLPETAYEGTPAAPGGTDAMDATGDVAGAATSGRDAGEAGTEAERASAMARHEPIKGSHSHPHPAYGSQGSDANHSHEHTHDGDASHSHSHAQDAPADAPAEGDSAGRADVPDEAAERAAAVDNSDWDASKAWSNGANSPNPAVFYAGICAGRKAGDKSTQAAWALPYKYHPGDAPNAAGVRDALSRLPQTQGLTDAAQAKAALERAMKQIDPGYTPSASGGSGDSGDSGTSGRSETVPAASDGTGDGTPEGAAAQGTVEPHQHSTAASTSSTDEGKNDVDGTPTIEERAARRDEIDSRILAISDEYADRAYTPEIQAEWDALGSELDEHTRALDEHERALTARRERVAAIHARQRLAAGQASGERVDGTASGYTAPAGNGQGRSAPAFIPSRDDGIYDVAAVRQRGLSLDESATAYRENALRVVERGTFPGSESRERSQSVVERLLNSIDDEEATLARRVMVTGSPLYMRAWGKAMARQSPLAMTQEEQAALERGRALAVGTGSAGGFAVPFQLDPTVILTSNGAINPLRQISRTATITGKEYDLVTSAGVSVSRSAENAAMADNTPTLAQPTVKAERVTAFVPFSMEVEQDWAALQSEMMMLIADAKDVEESSSFTNGDGTGTNAGGILGTLGTASNVSGGSTANLTAADLYALEDVMPPRFRPRANWMASKTTYNAYRQLFTAVASSAGDPWARPSQGQPAELLGYPAYEDSDMVTTHASGDRPIILGDFGRGFLIVDRVGMSSEVAPVLFDQSTGRPSGQRGLICFWRNNSVILIPNAFRAIKVL
jgi:HK97 family phage major capsid protein/HK97 family phage prohead protease